MTNYVVKISDWYGKREVKCRTKAEVWEAIDSRSFGGLYEVSSPTGKSISEFIPF